MPAVRFAFTACAIGSEIYIFGGHDGRVSAQASVFKLETVTDEWNTVAPMPCTFSYHSVSVLDGLVYIVGAGASSREVLCFDRVLNGWNSLAPILGSRKTCATFVVGGCLYAAGGSGQSLGVERYDVADNTWTAVADMLGCRSSFGAVTIGSASPAEEQDLFDALIVKAAYYQNL
jgi:kelch-like protein 10